MKNVALIPNLIKDPELKTSLKLAKFLIDIGGNVYISDEFSAFIQDIPVSFFKKDISAINDLDFVITLGGDGTLLGVARVCSQNNIPVLGINMGRVGFLAELEVSQFDEIKKIFDGSYFIENRMLLDIFVNDEKKYTVLNDLYISGATKAHVAEMDLFLEDKKIAHYRTDSLIFSTPTGSTAYSLSAGGAVVDPELECICITPACSHSIINSRSLIFSAESIFNIKNISARSDECYLYADGLEVFKLDIDDVVKIKKSNNSLKLIKILNRGFYDILFNKFYERG